MPLFNEGNTKQPKANKLGALKRQSYKYIISKLIKILKNYLQCQGIKILQNRSYKIDYYLQLKIYIKIQPRYQNDAVVADP